MSIFIKYIGWLVKVEALKNSKLSLAFYLTIVLQFLWLSMKAQIYPVSVTPILVPPYPLYIDEYYKRGTERLAVVLLNTDLQQPTLNVKLRMSVEGPGLKLQTRSDAYLPSISLDAGIPRRINFEDLDSYFKPDILLVFGAAKAIYSRNNRLPEGQYSFCFEVLDGMTNQVLSRKSCCMAWISLCDPPMLNLPLNGESIAVSEIQNIIFQWTPRNLGNPDNAFNTEYEFTLKEIWDVTIPPQVAFQNTFPIYQTTIKNTTLLIGPSEPQLIPGKRYAWQVRAKSNIVSEQYSSDYRNDGYSEVFWFTYQNDCKPPFVINAEITGSTANLSWINNIANEQLVAGYSIQYREYRQCPSEWYTINTLYPKAKLQNLKPSTIYECRVGNHCNISNVDIRLDQAAYSQILMLETGSVVNAGSTQNCGMISSDIRITNHSPIQDLNPGDLIVAGGFPVKITKISGKNSFAGEGYVTIPLLGQNNVRVHFNQIKVNTDRLLFEGIIKTTYDSTASQVANIDKFTEGGHGTGSVQSGNEYVHLNVDFVIEGVNDIRIESKSGTDSTTRSMLITVKGSSGEITNLPTNELPVLIKDSKGTIYNIENNANGLSIVTKVGTHELINLTSAELNKLDTAKGHVLFKPHPKQQFAFDEYQSAYAKSEVFSSDMYEKLDENYFVNAKAILPGKTDLVMAEVEFRDDRLTIDSIEFITSKGIRLAKRKIRDNSFEVSVIGGPAKDAQELFAVYPKPNGRYFSLGKLLIASYQPKDISLMLVPVNGATLDHKSIEQKINEIYNPIGIRIKVNKAENFNNTQWDLDHDGKLAIKGSNWLSSQTLEMKALNNAYKQVTTNLPNDIAILFILNGSDSTTNVKGDMPRGKQFGYLFNGADGNTVAHEIGHGIFHLEHTFKKYGFTKEDLQRNVMNYPPGDRFTKFQWDAIHAPGLVIDIFENDEDTMYETDGHFSTVYLVSLMLGMNNGKAAELAIATEAPDTKIHSPVDFELNQTWSYPTVQQNVHALTGGFHGVEEFITALKILYTPAEKVKEIGELLHRFGDTYAHTELDNKKPNHLLTYKLNDNPQLAKLAIDNWKGQGSQKLDDKIEPWIAYFNHCIKKYGLKFLSDENLQKKQLNNKTLAETLGEIYLLKSEDKFRMYGGKFMTFEHAYVDSTYPDLIYIRPEWYMNYVENLAWIIAAKYNLNELALDFNVFKKMVDYSVGRKCSLKGIIDYEISKRLNKKEVYIPVFYSKTDMPIATFEALFMTDYYKTAKDAAQHTRDYILRDGKTKVQIESNEGQKTKYGNKSGFFKTLAFKITYK